MTYVKTKNLPVKFYTLSAFVIFLLLFPFPLTITATSINNEMHYAPDRIIIKLKNEPIKPVMLKSTGDPSLDVLMSQFDVQEVATLFHNNSGHPEIKKRSGLSRIYLLIVPTSINIEDAVLAFSANPALNTLNLIL